MEHLIKLAPMFLLVVALGVFLYRGLLYSRRDWQRERMNELSNVAKKLGFRFKPDSDFQLAQQFGFLNLLRQGDTRFAFNVMSGRFRDHTVTAFDYHFCTSSENRGRISIQQFYLTVLTLEMECSIPEVTIARESWKSKLMGAVGWPDINFESAEFSNGFCVRSKDKKFAYDICNGRVMEYLLDHRDLNIEIEGGTLALVFTELLPAAQIEMNLRQLVEIRSRLPEYLFNSLSPGGSP